jgi:hypothetical protein
MIGEESRGSVGLTSQVRYIQIRIQYIIAKINFEINLFCSSF